MTENAQNNPHLTALGAVVESIGGGRARMRLPFSANLVGDAETDILHGGVLTALLDNVGGSATFSALPPGTVIATLDLRIDYMRPAQTGREIVAEAHCYRKTRNVAFVRGVAFHEDTDDPVA
ncbi:MAG: PaaI family thioesterase, partial [Acidobacteriota bacterium]